MSKEYIWSIVADGDDHVWKCIVTDTECIFYEEDTETDRLIIANPEKKQGVLQIDDEVNVFGKVCPFQLENGIPYVKIDTRWVMSDTTMAERHRKMVYNQKVVGLVQIVGAALITLVYFVLSQFNEGVKDNWFILIMASFFAVVGASQFFSARKELKTLAVSGEEMN